MTPKNQHRGEVGDKKMLIDRYKIVYQKKFKALKKSPPRLSYD